jgi:predicted nucleotidyltransferase
MGYARSVAIDRDLMHKLHEALAVGPPLRLAIVFGSLALGRARPDSDLDVAVVPANSGLTRPEELRLESVLSAASGRDVDLVRLDHAIASGDHLLVEEIMRHGVCVEEETPGLFAAERARLVARAIDWEETVRPHRDRFLRRLAERQR